MIFPTTYTTPRGVAFVHAVASKNLKSFSADYGPRTLFSFGIVI